MLPETPMLPLPARWINRMAGLFFRKWDPVGRLTAAEVLKKVSRRVGLRDYGNPHFIEGLDALLTSIQTDADLTFFGKMIQRAVIEKNLENRLKITAYLKRHPEIEGQPIIPPIIVLGLPRSGTTFLHRLLAQDPRNRGLRFWELTRPVPPERGPDLRETSCRFELEVFRRLSLPLDHIHFTRAGEYEECIWLQMTTFESVGFWMFAPVFGYIEWLQHHDLMQGYREYAAILKRFQAETPKQRLTLKTPAHTGALPELALLFPDAIFVQAHRNPVDVMHSMNSLVYAAHANVSNRMDARRTAAFNMRLLRDVLTRNQQARARGIRVNDIRYEDLIRAPLSAIEDLYERCGIEMTAAASESIRRYVRENPIHKFGRHRYSETDFQISDDRIREVFADYIQAVGL